MMKRFVGFGTAQHFFFRNYILQFSFQSVAGESLATSSAGNIDIRKKKIIKKGFFGMPVK